MNNTETREIIEISLEDIIPNRFQPRLTFDIDALNDLARSIKEHGIIQPLVVRKLQDKYEIVAGERRYKAAAIAGLKKVPCIVMNLNDGESAEVAIIENIQRKEMTPLEEARSFKTLLDKGYLTQEDLGKRMGKSQSSVANKLRLLNLDDVVQEAILENKISERHARSLLKLNNKEDQRKILSDVIEKRLTVKQTDDLIKERYGVVSMNEEAQQNKFINNSFYGDENTNKSSNQGLSSPEVNIPLYGKQEGSNPQTRILNSLGNINPVQENTYEDKTAMDSTFNFSSNPALDIFKNTPEAPQNIVNNNVVKQEEDTEENMIDPSKLQPSNYKKVEPEIKMEPTDINLNMIKENAQNIGKEEIPAANIESLLFVENPQKEKKFLVDLENVQSNNVQSNNVQSNKEEKMEFFDVEEEPNYKQVKDRVGKQLEELKQKGIRVYKEEADFGNTYQIIIRIDK